MRITSDKDMMTTIINKQIAEQDEIARLERAEKNGMEKGMEKGLKEGKKEVAKKLLEMEMDVEKRL